MLLLLLAGHRPLHPLLCPASVVDVCAAAAATDHSSVGISCSRARRLHGAVQTLQLAKGLQTKTTLSAREREKPVACVTEEEEDEEEEEGMEHDHAIFTLRAPVVTE